MSRLAMASCRASRCGAVDENHRVDRTPRLDPPESLEPPLRTIQDHWCLFGGYRGRIGPIGVFGIFGRSAVEGTPIQPMSKAPDVSFFPRLRG